MLSIAGLSPNWTSLIILLAIITIVWVFDRKNFKREGIMFLRRTKQGLLFIDRFAKRHQKALEIFGTLGIVLSFGALGAGYIFRAGKKKHPDAKALAVFAVLLAATLQIFKSIYAVSLSLFGASGFVMAQFIEGIVNLFTAPANAPQLQFVLPIQTTSAPVFYVPIDFWLISIFVLLIVHEFSHAFVSRAEGVRVNSLGYGFLAVIPLGFAEPDERELKKTDSIKRSRIFAAGSFSNIIAALLSAILLAGTTVATSAMYTTDGVIYGSVVPGTPADISLPHNGTITQVNSKVVHNTEELSQIMDIVYPGNDISIVVNSERQIIKTTSDPKNSSRAFIGVSGIENVIVAKEQYAGFAGSGLSSVLFYFASLFRWLLLLNLGIGLFNLLPLKPLDGGLIFEEITKKFWPKSWKLIYGAVAMTTLGLILLNLFGSYIVRAIAAVV